MMAAAISSISARIAAIIPRLASDYDGEVVASARAIDRILRSANADWHDLTAAFERGAATVAERPDHDQREYPWTWTGSTIEEREKLLVMLMRSSLLSDWEYSFVASLRRRSHLSAKQIRIVDELFERAFYSREGAHA